MKALFKPTKHLIPPFYPLRTITFESIPFNLLAFIMPFDLEMPIPNEPVFANIFGVLMSG